MTQTLNLAKNILLAPAALDETGIERLFKTMVNHHIDDADLYFQSCHYESWFLEDSEVKSGSFSLDKVWAFARLVVIKRDLLIVMIFSLIPCSVRRMRRALLL